MKIKRAGIGLISIIVLAAIIIYASVTLIKVREKIDLAEEQHAELLQEKESLEADNAEKEYALENSDDDETIEDIARDYGYVQPGETVYTDGED